MTDDLTSDDRVVLARFLRRTLREAKFPMSDANRELRAILEKLEPPPNPNLPHPHCQTAEAVCWKAGNGNGGVGFYPVDAYPTFAEQPSLCRLNPGFA
jgi:hypothetical protein